ncbi:MAG: AAA family ATPase [Blastocatellia bacterium]
MRANPFIIEQAIRGDALVDRQEELLQVRTALLQGGKLFLIGPRRFGKTSILLTASEQLRESGGRAIYLNLQSLTTIEAVINELIRQTLDLRTNIRKGADQTRRFFARFNPNITVDPLEQSFNVSLGIKTPEPAKQNPLLIEALRSLELMAKKEGSPMGVIFDEFQEILRIGGEEIEKQLRAETQLHEHVGYVYAGSETSLLTDMISNPKRPFYKLGLPLFIRSIPRADFTRQIRNGFRRIKSEVGDDALELIFETAQDAPHTIQVICHLLWDRTLQRGAKKVARADVESTIRTLLGIYDPVYSGIWTRLVSNQRRVLLIIASGVTTGLLRQSVLHEHRLSAANMRRALQALETQQLVRRDDVQREKVYHFEDPLLRAWVRRNTDVEGG